MVDAKNLYDNLPVDGIDPEDMVRVLKLGIKNYPEYVCKAISKIKSLELDKELIVDILLSREGCELISSRFDIQQVYDLLR